VSCPGWDLDSVRYGAGFLKASGKTTILHLPESGLVGNRHLLIMEKNNFAIADLLIDWIAKN